MIQTANKIKTRQEAQAQVQAWKAKGEKVVFTNGCFDLLHLGHVDYLEKARNLGDRLVVALNTDASVGRLKGPTRPITPEGDRARVIAALSAVDLVLLFDEDTPMELLEELVPNVLVKGADYALKDIVGADLMAATGGEVSRIAFVAGRSTSSIVEKIKGQ